MNLIRHRSIRAARRGRYLRGSVRDVREVLSSLCPDGFLGEVEDLRLGFEGKLKGEEGEE
jgi:hypothetical protein